MKGGCGSTQNLNIGEGLREWLVRQYPTRLGHGQGKLRRDLLDKRRWQKIADQKISVGIGSDPDLVSVALKIRRVG
jgi:hypothetical protein